MSILIFWKSLQPTRYFLHDTPVTGGCGRFHASNPRQRHQRSARHDEHEVEGGVDESIPPRGFARRGDLHTENPCGEGRDGDAQETRKSARQVRFCDKPNDQDGNPA